MYQKFKSKYIKIQNEMESNLNQSSFSSSNLNQAIDLAIKMASNLSSTEESKVLDIEKAEYFV